MAHLISFLLSSSLLSATQALLTCPGFPGYCSESFPGQSCNVVCEFGRNNVPLCQDDGTWTDIPRCIEHDPGVDEQIPGTCPAIPGYCSQGFLNTRCTFDCTTGKDINSLCTVDGTWEPYPTCNGDRRETRDGCDGCPGPVGAARNRTAEAIQNRNTASDRRVPKIISNNGERKTVPSFAGNINIGVIDTQKNRFNSQQRPGPAARPTTTSPPRNFNNFQNQNFRQQQQTRPQQFPQQQFQQQPQRQPQQQFQQQQPQRQPQRQPQQQFQQQQPQRQPQQQFQQQQPQRQPQQQFQQQQPQRQPQRQPQQQFQQQQPQRQPQRQPQQQFQQQQPQRQPQRQPQQQFQQQQPQRQSPSPSPNQKLSLFEQIKQRINREKQLKNQIVEKQIEKERQEQRQQQPQPQQTFSQPQQQQTFRQPQQQQTFRQPQQQQTFRQPQPQQSFQQNLGTFGVFEAVDLSGPAPSPLPPPTPARNLGSRQAQNEGFFGAFQEVNLQ